MIELYIDSFQRIKYSKENPGYYCVAFVKRHKPNNSTKRFLLVNDNVHVRQPLHFNLIMMFFGKKFWYHRRGNYLIIYNSLKWFDIIKLCTIVSKKEKIIKILFYYSFILLEYINSNCINEKHAMLQRKYCSITL